MKAWSWIAAIAIVAMMAGCAPKTEGGSQEPGATPKATSNEPGETSPAPGATAKGTEQNLGNSGTVDKGGEAKSGAKAEDVKGTAEAPKAVPPPKDPPAKTQPVNDNAALKDVVGNWTMIIPGRAQAINEDMKKKGKLPFSGKLEIKADGSYVFEFGLAGKGSKTKGQASVKDGLLMLVATDDGGKDAQVKAQPKGTTYTFKLSKDGKELLSDMKERTNLGFRRN